MTAGAETPDREQQTGHQTAAQHPEQQATPATPGESGQSPAEPEGELTPARVMEALKGVFDPELMVNVVDLGLVYNVEVKGNEVNVDLGLTSPMCPAGPQMMMQAKQAIEALRPGIVANVRLTLDPPWTPDRMSEEARNQLGFF